jgi:hypothetical protein
MSKPTKTNPAYASLAYRKAILQWVSSSIRNRLLGVTGDPPEALLCDDVFPVDAEVPADELVEYIGELNEEEARLGLEMNKFEFTRRSDAKPEQSQRQQQKKPKGKKGGSEGGQGAN